ncbi:MAG TPA: hypothetical protein VHD62_05685 [Opitutaceae bacterium]|nr:hypothetical protein [Opitutaceae bacterium]
MKIPRRLLVWFIVLWLFAGCASYPGTSSLWVGMTREQALRAMGPPDSVSAQGKFEYLNYTIAASGGYIARPYYIRLVDNTVESFGYQGQFVPGATGPVAGNAAAAPGTGVVRAAKVDRIRVLDTEPQQLTLGRSNHLKVKLSYALQSQQQGTIILSFNTKTPDIHLSLARKDIPGGSGEFSLELDLTPLDWPGRSAVTMMASLYPRLTGNQESSLDNVIWDLPANR